MPAARSIQSYRCLSGLGDGSAFRSLNVPLPATQQVQRAVLAMLISALWLVASGHAVLDEADPEFVGLNSSSTSSVEHGKRGPLGHACYKDPAARRINRRFGTQLSGDGSSPPLTTSPALPMVEPPSTLFPASALLGLAECWQFHWRTALDPRAPARIS